ncbi:hypothetical protein [Haloarchaeobius sp. DFWS5]|uniref:hypothetical protein n=1 Tax=Haloarchaeobius sp. DFWS5 TaxID=3446114 RepID=UPI003EBAF5F0
MDFDEKPTKKWLLFHGISLLGFIQPFRDPLSVWDSAYLVVSLGFVAMKQWDWWEARVPEYTLLGSFLIAGGGVFFYDHMSMGVETALGRLSLVGFALSTVTGTLLIATSITEGDTLVTVGYALSVSVLSGLAIWEYVFGSASPWIAGFEAAFAAAITLQWLARRGVTERFSTRVSVRFDSYWSRDLTSRFVLGLFGLVLSAAAVFVLGTVALSLFRPDGAPLVAGLLYAPILAAGVALVCHAVGMVSLDEMDPFY